MKTLIFYDKDGKFQIPAIGWNTKKQIPVVKKEQRKIKVKDDKPKKKEQKDVFKEITQEFEVITHIDEADDDFLNRIGKKDCPENMSYKIIDEKDLPESFIGYIYKNDKFVFVKDLAIKTRINALRSKRDQELKKLDIEYNIALDVDDTQKCANISKHRQQLRDMPDDKKWHTEKDYIPSYL